MAANHTLVPFRERLRRTFYARHHMERLTGVFVLVVVQVVVVMNCSHLLTDLTFVTALGGRDLLLGIFYAEEFL